MGGQIVALEKEIEQKEARARYLAGGKKGYCWGRKTDADDRRENELTNRRMKLSFIKQKRTDSNATTQQKN